MDVPVELPFDDDDDDSLVVLLRPDVEEAPKVVDVALDYVRRGWSIFPLGPPTATKHGEPLIKWKRLQNERPTPEEVRKWWTEWPNAGIAIVTGRISGLVVVDVDAQHGGTSDGLPATGCIALTGSGGRHHLYRYPKNARNVANQVNSEDCPDAQRRGRDVRADGGYINAAPSPHRSGRHYAWESLGEPGEPPEWALTPATQPKQAESDQDKWLSKLLRKGASREGLANGERNDSLIKMAGYFAGKRIPVDVGYELCLAWLRNTIDDDDFTESEVETTVRSAYHTESKRREDDGEIEGVRMDTVEAKSVPWLWDGRIPRGMLTLLIGDPGLGKSTVLLDIAARLSSGRPMPGEHVFEDEQPRERVSIVYLTAEDSLEYIVKARLDRSGADASRVIALRAVRNGNDRRPIRFDRDIVKLEKAIADADARLVIVDPLSAYLGDANSWKDSEIRSVLGPLAEVAERTDAAIVGIMHLTKASDRTVLHRAQGSIAFAAAARMMLVVGEHPDDAELPQADRRRIFACRKSNVSIVPRESLTFTIGDSGLEWGEPCEVSAEQATTPPPRSKPRRSELDPLTAAIGEELWEVAPRPTDEFYAAVAAHVGADPLNESWRRRVRTIAKTMGAAYAKQADGRATVVRAYNE